MNESKVNQILIKHEARILSLPGVEGVGIQERAARPVIVVYLRNEAAGKNIPAELDGVPVVGEISGAFEALAADELHPPGLAGGEPDDRDSMELGNAAAPFSAPGAGGDVLLIHVLDKYEPQLLAIPGVSGIGIQVNEDGEEAIAVYVQDEAVKSQIPQQLDGIPVVVEVSGPFIAFPHH